MGKITEISAQKRNQNRVNIYVDGEFFIGAEAIAVLENRLKVGMEVTEDELKKMCMDSDRTSAFNKALRYIGQKPCTLKRISEYLKEKGYEECTITEVVGMLKEYEYVNDEEYVRTYIDHYASKYGKKRLAQKLQSKGAEKAEIEKAMETVGSQQDAACAAVEKYLKSRNFDYKKITAYLSYRGFDWEEISYAVKKYSAISERNEEEDEYYE